MLSWYFSLSHAAWARHHCIPGSFWLGVNPESSKASLYPTDWSRMEPLALALSNELISNATTFDFSLKKDFICVTGGRGPSSALCHDRAPPPAPKPEVVVDPDGTIHQLPPKNTTVPPKNGTTDPPKGGDGGVSQCEDVTTCMNRSRHRSSAHSQRLDTYIKAIAKQHDACVSRSLAAPPRRRLVGGSSRSVSRRDKPPPPYRSGTQPPYINI